MTVEDALAERDPSLLDAADVARELGTDPSRGLTSAEAATRLERFGPNVLQGAPRTPAWRQLLAQFADPLIYLLLAAIAVSALAWWLEGAHGLPVEAIVIAAIVAGNGILAFLQERGAEAAVAALQRMAAPTAHVLRDGEIRSVPAADIVPGDVLVLAEGDAVGADGRLLSASALTVSEAALTGESEAVLKQAAPLPAVAALGDRVNMVYSGTAVVRGQGRAVVTSAGMRTEMGRIARLLESTKEDRTPLQVEIDRVGRLLTVAVIAIAIVVVVAILLTSQISTPAELVDVLLLGVSLAVAAVPEGLPAILTVILALGVQRMARQHAIVKRLSSVETLGSASVICSDKTGTLTRNEMTIQRIVTHSGQVEITGTGYRPDGEVLVDGRPLDAGPLRSEVRAVLGAGSMAGDAVLRIEDGEWIVEGDPTEAAFLVAERKLGTWAVREQRFTRRGEIPFSSERRMMSTLEADAGHGGRIALMTKGAPGAILPNCSRERVGTSEVPLSDRRRSEILAAVDQLGDDALRALAVAYRPLDTTHPPEADDSLERDLVFAGVAGMMDPPRNEAADAVAEAHRAGIRVVMITGDHERTAATIAANLGIAGEDSATIDGGRLDAIDDGRLVEVVRSASVFARVAPAHKLRIVGALQADGAVVAMTGDGVNDAPALKAADIGIAMGITGTDVSAEAADMILADDNFATIVAAVREGRTIFANIRRFLRYLLGSNAGEVLTMLGGALGASIIGLQSGGAFVAPLLATQILWINLLTDSAPALALGFEPAARDVMHRPPRGMRERAIDADMALGVVFIGTVMAAAALLTLDLGLPGGLIEGSASLDEARTMAFTVLVLAQLFNALNARSETLSAFDRPFGNLRLVAALGMSLALQVIVVHVGFLNQAFSTVPLSLEHWALCALLASSVLWAEEVRKRLRRRSDLQRVVPLE